MNIIRLGISAAIISMFLLLTIEVFRHKPLYEAHRWAICASLVVMGALLAVIGGCVNRNIRQSSQSADGDAPSTPFILANIQYWGLMFALFGIIVVFVAPSKKVQAREVAPVPPAANSNTNTFPALKLQGVVLGTPRPSVIINGRTYFPGDFIGDVKLISIEATNAVVEFKGRPCETQARQERDRPRSHLNTHRPKLRPRPVALLAELIVFVL